MLDNLCNNLYNYLRTTKGKDVIKMFCFNVDSEKGHNHLSTISMEE